MDEKFQIDLKRTLNINTESHAFKVYFKNML